MNLRKPQMKCHSIFNKYGVCVGGGLFSSYSEVAARFGEVLISAFNFFCAKA